MFTTSGRQCSLKTAQRFYPSVCLNNTPPFLCVSLADMLLVQRLDSLVGVFQLFSRLEHLIVINTETMAEDVTTHVKFFPYLLRAAKELPKLHSLEFGSEVEEVDLTR